MYSFVFVSYIYFLYLNDCIEVLNYLNSFVDMLCFDIFVVTGVSIYHEIPGKVMTCTILE